MNKFTKIFVGALAAVAIFASAASAAYTHTGLLKMGMTSSQVMSLQQALNANGFLVSTTGAGSPGMESMYFGAKTKAAVMAYQSAKGLTPVDGIVGNITGTSLMANAGGGSGVYPAGCSSNSGFSTTTGMPCSSASLPTGCTSTTGFSPVTGASCAGGSTSTGPLAGTDGSISAVDELSQYSSEEVGEGQKDVKIVGFEVEATNDGDIAIKSAKLSFTITNDSGSDNLDDYIDGASIWMGSTKVGSVDANDFSEGSSGVWTKTVTLSSPVVKADKTEKFYVSVDAANSFDSGDIDSEIFTADVDNLRFEDGSGVVTTEDAYDLGSMDVNVAFVSYSTAADTELKISKDSSSPSSAVVIIDENDNTDNVILLKGKMKLEGSSDVTIDELPITLTTVGGANVAAVTNSLTLKIGGDEYTETVSITGATSGTVTFDNLNFDVNAGDTVNFEILADINDIDAGNLDEGDTLTASLTPTNRDYIDVENEQGDQLSDSSEKTGTATGSSQELRSEGVSATFVSQSTSVTSGQSSNDDLGTLKIQFKVTAVGDTVYMSSLAGTSGAATNLFVVDRSGTATTGGVSGTLTMINLDSSSDDDLTAAGNYTIEEGEVRTFELVATVQLPTAGSAGQFKAALSTLKWNTDNSTTYQSYTQNLDSFKTSYLGLN